MRKPAGVRHLALFLALVLGGGIIWFAAASGREAAPAPSPAPSPGPFPQGTQAKDPGDRCRRAGDPGDDLEQAERDCVALRFARDRLGWRHPNQIAYSVGGGQPYRAELIECAAGENPRFLAYYPDIDCQPELGASSYPAASLVLERDGDGAWAVTRAVRDEIPWSIPVPPEHVHAFLSAFLDRRVAGSGAEDFVSDAGMEDFEGGAGFPGGGPHSLYGGYSGFEILSVGRPLWPDGSYESTLHLLAEGRTLGETLSVRPTDHETPHGWRLEVIGGYTGTTGP